MQNYKILAQVGEGTYGRVFRARDLRTNQEVALKHLFVLNKEEGVSYLALQELKFLKLLHECKHVITLLDVFMATASADDNNNASESLCFVFNYASADLTGLLSDVAYTPTLAHIKCLFRQVLLGLAEIHRKNLMHRDIKAANLLIHHGHLRLGDVGMMTNFKQHNEFSHNVVTLWYRSPELLLGATKYGPEVDMWSAGIVLIEMMTKKSPFPGMSEQHQMDLIFKVLGTPDPSTWPGVDSLPGWGEVRKGQYKQNQLRKVFRDWNSEALDLLEKLLAPAHSRCTAEQALQHPFFSVAPLPCEPLELGHLLPASHEFEVKRKRKADTTAPSAAVHSNAAAHDQTNKRLMYAHHQPSAVPRGYPAPHQQQQQQQYRQQQQQRTQNAYRFDPPPSAADPSYSRAQPYKPPHIQQQQQGSRPPTQHHQHPHYSQHQQPFHYPPHPQNVGHVHVPAQRDTQNLHMFHGASSPSSHPGFPSASSSSTSSSSSAAASALSMLASGTPKLSVAPRTHTHSLTPQSPTHPQSSPDRPPSSSSTPSVPAVPLAPVLCVGEAN